MWNIVPLDTYPNKIIHVTVKTQNNVNKQLIFHLRYNTEGRFWRMDVSDYKNNMLISGVPLITGEYPAANILKQFDYLGIGSAVVLRMTDDQDKDIPDLTNLGTDFVLAWGDGNPND